MSCIGFGHYGSDVAFVPVVMCAAELLSSEGNLALMHALA